MPIETDATMSPYLRDSELARFNRFTGARRFPASDDLRRVAADALRIAEMSDGAFDPTVGPLVRRYGFGPISGMAGGFRGLSVDVAGIAKADSGLTLDLCGIAKGHALDRIVARLEVTGVRRALVELGGETRAIGSHPDGRPWLVGVERPGSDALELQRIVRPGRLALATSGTRPNGFAARGVQVSHVIDPRSGRPVPGTPSVTVAAATACEADAWATALLVLGHEEGPDVAERLGLAALLLMPDGGALREVMTGGFEDLVVE
jgi:thiamine biosynthesis lipoprotein